MSILLPNATTVGDLCVRALKDAGILGVGQSPLAEDINDAWTLLQWMLQQWARKRWMIFHNVTYTTKSTLQTSPYSVGPGGQLDTSGPSDFNADFNADFGPTGLTVRPNQIESAFFEQSLSGNVTPSPIVYPLKLYRAMEDYRRIALPNLLNFPQIAFYDPAWPLGQLYLYPWPNNPQYSVGIVCREQLPQAFGSLTDVISLPYEYFEAIASNLAIRLRPGKGIGTFPGDMLPSIAKNGMETIRKGSTQIANLQMPGDLVGRGQYNIYSDQSN
jgi:hypothetical protein